jgi:hypothetical protein
MDLTVSIGAGEEAVAMFAVDVDVLLFCCEYLLCEA